MKRSNIIKILFCVVLYFSFPSLMEGQNPIDAARMPSGSASLPDSVWAGAGVQGGIPSDTWPDCDSANCNTLFGGTVTATSINNAVGNATHGGTSCSVASPCVVRIPAGTFTLSSGISPKSGVVIRGAGANSTFLTINGTAPNGCGYFFNGAIGMCADSGDVPAVVNWTAGFAQGTTRITLDSRTNIVPGTTTLHLMQDNDVGYPGSNDLFLCDTSACAGAGGPSCGTPGYTGVDAKCVAEEVLVTACVTTCNGTSGQVDIDPPITLPNFRTGQNAQAMYDTNTSQFLTWAGVEDLAMTTNQQVDFEWVYSSNTWIKGVRVLFDGGASDEYVVFMIRSVHNSIVDSYFFRQSYSEQAAYVISMAGVGSLLIQNNICQGTECFFVTDNLLSNSVISYNFTPGSSYPMFVRHLAGEANNLIEGNITKSVWTDATDGMGCCQTFMRNGFIGDRFNNDANPSNINAAAQFDTKNRFHNFIGNVMGDSSIWNTYQGRAASGACSGSGIIYDLGATGCSGTSPGEDDNVAASMLRWGNWDEVTSTSPTTDGDQTGTRWCGDSSNTGWTTRCSSTSEVPTGYDYLSNPVPATETLASSMYLSSKPAWFGSLAWPPIGPDVSGGTITNLGGHVKYNAAANCYFNVMGGPTDGSGSILPFDAATCYTPNPMTSFKPVLVGPGILVGPGGLVKKP